MRATGLRLPILVTLTLASLSSWSRAEEVLFLETADWVPTASVLTVPTSLLATTAVLPTSYVIPTAYSTAYMLETAYVTPATVLEPTYYETRFRRRGLFGRRLVETTRAYYIPTTAYYPTTYFYPTVFSGPAVVDRVVPTEYVATTATSCCGTVVADAPVVVRSAPVDRPAASPAPSAPSRSRQSRIESEPDDESISSEVSPTRATEPPASKPATPRAAEPRSSEVSPPPQPAAPREKAATPRPDASTPATKGAAGNPATAGAANPAASGAQTKTRSTVPAPTAPGGDLPDVTPAEDDQLFPAPDKDAASKSPGTVRRDNLKPVLPTRTIRSEYRNVLVGIVRDRRTDDPEDEVRVTVTSRTDPTLEKVAMSNAFGKFAVRLPDGDWTVKVTMPSGRVYPVSRITVSGGLVFDEDGRDIPSLIITR